MAYAPGWENDPVALEAKRMQEAARLRQEARAKRVKTYKKLLSGLTQAELEWFQADLAEGATVVSAGLDSQGNAIVVQGALNKAVQAAITEKR
jgi:hypothetical protein